MRQRSETQVKERQWGEKAEREEDLRRRVWDQQEKAQERQTQHRIQAGPRHSSVKAGRRQVCRQPRQKRAGRR